MFIRGFGRVKTGVSVDHGTLAATHGHRLTAPAISKTPRVQLGLAKAGTTKGSILADDWQCNKCRQVSLARKSKCNFQNTNGEGTKSWNKADKWGKMKYQKVTNDSKNKSENLNMKTIQEPLPGYKWPRPLKVPPQTMTYISKTMKKTHQNTTFEITIKNTGHQDTPTPNAVPSHHTSSGSKKDKQHKSLLDKTHPVRRCGKNWQTPSHHPTYKTPW